MKSERAAIEPFTSGEECLESWFLALGPMTGSGGDHPTGVVPIEVRLPHLRALAARSAATRDAGVPTPVLDAIEGLHLDLLDRLLLLALLRDDLDARTNGGLRIATLCDAVGAATWSHQALVCSRLEEAGALRRHALVESDSDSAPADRLYRLAPRWKHSLLAGCAEAPPETFDLPDTPAARIQAALVVASLVIGRVAPDPNDRTGVWSDPLPDRPGWDSAARCRRGLLEYVRAFLSPSGPASGDPIASVLRKAGVTTERDAALFVLVLASTAADASCSWVLLSVALDGATPGPGTLPCPANSPLIAAGLIQVEAREDEPLHSVLRATPDALARAIPSGLPPVHGLSSFLTRFADVTPEHVERIHPRVALDGVVLAPSARAGISEALSLPSAIASLAGAGWGVEDSLLGSPGVALLFYGPPGTGKTLCAEAIAGQLGRKLWRLRTDRILSCFVGQTEKHLVEVFAAARESGDVVLLDEADSLLTTRDQAVRTWEATMTNVLLQEIERFPGVVVLTTNRDAVLDPALERRLAARIGFQLPDAGMRELLWERHLPRLVPRAPDVDLSSLARSWPLSGSLIRTAALYAVARAASRDGQERCLTRADLESAARTQAERGAGRRASVGFAARALPPQRLTLVVERLPERKESR
ncbi:MAG: ATP-binding protein [Thermoanaerobaculia bacterium]